jgi:hypothetical protein
MFPSSATNLARGVSSGVYVHDRVAHRTEVVSLSADGKPLNGNAAAGASMTPDGRYVAFESSATNLPPGDPTISTYTCVRHRVARTRVGRAWLT